AGFGASFGPVIILSLCWRRMTKWGALAGMIAGATTVIVWANSSYASVMYEMVPGFIASLIAIVIVSVLTVAPDKQVTEQFDTFKRTISS
ncbi:MAG: sodium:proline symporter, partial [Anoxybacillus gonensis]|nr:sodium:proline symporter [Anoxybacillus gonensis]